MNRWTICGLAYLIATLFGLFYLGHRIDLWRWIDDEWWHAPIAVVAVVTFVVSWAFNIYGRSRKR
jgi:amino acid transporter